MIKKLFLVCFLFPAAVSCYAQDISFARKMVDTLTSPYFYGRGYTAKGMEKAADFLSGQFRSYGLMPLNGKSFSQEFSYPVNTFPGEMEVALNGKALIPGRDFIVSPDSRGINGKGNLIQKDSATFVDPQNRIIVIKKNKLTWSVASAASDYTVIEIDNKSFPEMPSYIELNIANKIVPDFKSSNICGIVKGTVKPDSAIVISGHYDHLGGMGDKTYFPGANDNASGVSLLLGLAKYYAANPQRYSIVFLLFGGEEAGLLGSKYYTEHPIFPLDKIRFLTNIDMTGTGTEGITVVNGQLFTREFSMLSEINNNNKYLTKVNARGKAANSDHYWFTEKGIPAFFIYTLGGIKAYHDVFDVAATLPLNEYEDLLSLLVEFNTKLMN